MDGNKELRETDIKNRTCYYFDDIMRVGDFGFDNKDKNPIKIHMKIF